MGMKYKTTTATDSATIASADNHGTLQLKVLENRHKNVYSINNVIVKVKKELRIQKLLGVKENQYKSLKNSYFANTNHLKVVFL